MPMTFDATLKDMGRDSPQGFLTVFDRPPTVPFKLLNVDLSTVTTAADLILGLGEPLQEIIQLDFQARRRGLEACQPHGLSRAYCLPTTTCPFIQSSSSCVLKRPTRT